MAKKPDGDAPATSQPEPAGGKGGPLERARALAANEAPAAVEAMIAILKKPPRNAVAKLSAARELLRFAEGYKPAGDGGGTSEHLTRDDIELMKRFLEERSGGGT